MKGKGVKMKKIFTWLLIIISFFLFSYFFYYLIMLISNLAPFSVYPFLALILSIILFIVAIKMLLRNNAPQQITNDTQ
jgi:high-affinity Fe2+/Pb2+ permease